MKMSRFVFALAVTMSACESSSEKNEETKAGPLYSIGSVVAGPNGRTLFVQTVTSLDKDLTNANAMEVPGNSRHWAYNGSVYIGLAEEPTIVKYTPDNAGKLVEAGRVSFQTYGLANIPAGIAFITPTKAYLMAEKQYLAIVWDPTTMQIGTTIDLQSLKRDNYTVELYMNTVRGQTVYVPLRYVNYTAGDIAHESDVVIFDANQDKIVGVAKDERCVGAAQPSVLDDGTVYVLADGRGYLAQVYATTAQKPVPKNCILRILPGQTTYDPNYFVDIPALAAGKDAATSLYYAGNGVAYAKLFHQDQVAPGADTSSNGFWNNAAFKLWKFELRDQTTATEVEGAPFSIIAFGGASIDGKIYIGESGETSSSTVYELDPTTNQATSRFKMEGMMRDLYRLR